MNEKRKTLFRNSCNDYSIFSKMNCPFFVSRGFLVLSLVFSFYLLLFSQRILLEYSSIWLKIKTTYETYVPKSSNDAIVNLKVGCSHLQAPQESKVLNVNFSIFTELLIHFSHALKVQAIAIRGLSIYSTTTKTQVGENV